MFASIPGDVAWESNNVCACGRLSAQQVLNKLLCYFLVGITLLWLKCKAGNPLPILKIEVSSKMLISAFFSGLSFKINFFWSFSEWQPFHSTVVESRTSVLGSCLYHWHAYLSCLMFETVFSITGFKYSMDNLWEDSLSQCRLENLGMQCHW